MGLKDLADKERERQRKEDEARRKELEDERKALEREKQRMMEALEREKEKHSGLLKGKRYFMCQKGKGVFVDKKQILYKLEPSAKPNKKTKKKKDDGRKSSADLSSGGKKGKYKGGIARKTGPSQEKKSSKKGGWKPPSWTKDVLEDDGGFLDYRPAHRGTTGKAEYGKAGYLPHAKWRK